MGDKERMKQYRKEILEMVEEIHDEKTMNLIYWYVKRGYNEERARGKPAPRFLKNECLKKIT